MLLHHIFENQALQTPGALAIKSGKHELIYHLIEEKANQLAHYLNQNSVEVGDRILIYFKRTELPIVAMLGILKVGATYIPIDRSFPTDRIKHIIDDAQVKLRITETALLSELDVNCKKLDVLHKDT